MISIMTNEGALEFGRTLSGGTYFLAYECALLSETFNDVKTAAESLGSAQVVLDGETGGTITVAGGAAMPILHRFHCTGSLPVKVTVGNTEAMAVDFDFNGQTPVNKETGVPRSIEYSTVIALGLRFKEYPQATMGVTYHRGDHVWNGALRDKVYICAVDSVGYDGAALDDNPDWTSADARDLQAHPANPNYFADPSSDIVPFFVTSYDDPVTISNGMEWEYKVRVFLDNLLEDRLPELNYFSLGGIEGAGSLMLSFLASISGTLREIRNTESTVIL